MKATDHRPLVAASSIGAEQEVDATLRQLGAILGAATRHRLATNTYGYISRVLAARFSRVVFEDARGLSTWIVAECVQ